MFTVIICDEHIINDCYHKYQIYLKPLLVNEDFAFCAWNSEGKTLEEALPTLNNLVCHKREWNAIVVADNALWGKQKSNKRNPFDFVDSKRNNYKFDSYEEIVKNRESDAKTVERALSNPLTRLSIWLCGAPTTTVPKLCYEMCKDIIDAPLNSEQYYKAIKDYKLNVADVEMDYSRAQRFVKIRENFELHGELFNPPKSLLAIAERSKNVDQESAQQAWSHHTEFDYSRFYIDNLYPEKLRYLIFDLAYIKERRNENQYFNFLTSLLILATHECPNGVFRSNRVYKLNFEVDAECIRALCNNYNSKLCATLAKVDEVSKRVDDQSKMPVDKYTAQEAFESDVRIPIELVTKGDRDSLMADYTDLGLSSDCPTSEEFSWKEQYHAISKYFIRFLREPRRVVKNATKIDFKAMNKIEDDRVARLSEYQIENVEYNLVEEERNMVNTATTQLFNTKRFNERLRKADKNIKLAIAQRMTKKKTIIVGLVAALAYFFGLMPLLFSGINSIQSFTISLLITGIVLAAFLTVGLAYLFVLKYKLVKKYEDFNSEMSSIVNEVDDSVQSFSEYLSHACNVMREFSVLNYADSVYIRKQNILKNHRRLIMEKIDEVVELFASYIDPSEVRLSDEIEPYNYDFTVMSNYDYDMPYLDGNKAIVYMQQGYMINIPVDYVDSITITREELYD